MVTGHQIGVRYIWLMILEIYEVKEASDRNRICLSERRFLLQMLTDQVCWKWGKYRKKWLRFKTRWTDVKVQDLILEWCLFLIILIVSVSAKSYVLSILLSCWMCLPSSLSFEKWKSTLYVLWWINKNYNYVLRRQIFGNENKLWMQVSS